MSQRVDHRADAVPIFGDAMNEAEHCTMIDFLRSYSGENMQTASARASAISCTDGAAFRQSAAR